MFDYILKNKYKHIKKIYSKEKILTIAPGAIIPITFQVETVDFGAEERSCKGLYTLFASMCTIACINKI